MPVWIALLPLLIEMLWAASAVPRWRRWRAAQAEVEQKQGRPVHSIEDLDLVFMTASLVMAWEGRAAVVPRDIDWSARFLYYHLPVVLVLRLFGPIPNPHMGVRPGLALAMAITAALYGGLLWGAARRLT